MIVGNGMIARLFNEFSLPDGILIHASGVSDSSCLSQADFERDTSLLSKSIKSGKKIIYFSSQACGDVGLPSPYIEHKLRLESMIFENSREHIVLRIPQVASQYGNRNNLLNSFHDSLLWTGSVICFSNIKRNLIKDIHLKSAVEFVLKNNLDGLLYFCSPFDFTPTEIALAMKEMLNMNGTIEIKELERECNRFLCSDEFAVIREKMFGIDRDQYIRDIIKHAFKTK